MRTLVIRIAVAAQLVMASQVVGCRANCSAHTFFCNAEECRMVWDCAEETRELRVIPGGSCECIEGGAAAAGTCRADLCNMLQEANQSAIREGDSAFGDFDDAVNDACDWNVNTVEPLVLESCPP